MNKQAMISIHPEHAYNILIGKKTLEIRKWIPKDYIGWVHCYVTMGKPYLMDLKSYNEYCKDYVLGYVESQRFELTNEPYTELWNLNGKVAFKFWFEGYEQIRWNNDLDICFTMKMSQKKLLNDLQLTKEELISYVQDKIGYAWHINKLTIFDYPRELKKYYRLIKKSIVVDSSEIDNLDISKIYSKKTLTKAPQRLTWVYEEER
jgi:hypothetical protein